LAVCAVARSAAFRESVADVTGGAVELLAFADHHAFGADDVARIRARAAGREVVITEKDAVKLARHGVDAQATLVLEEELRWSWGADVLGARLDALAEQGVRP
jgi:tetraacyldisaccharide-1-P 4'-kinase